MSVGNDGFTDCNYVCNPENGMQWSCNKYCPDFKFIPAPTTTAYPTSEGVLDSQTTSSEHATVMNWIVYVSVGFVVVTLVVIFIYCCKRRILDCIQKRGKEQLKHSTQIEEATRVNGSRSNLEDGSTLPLVRHRSSEFEMKVLTRHSIDSGVSVNTGSVHLVNESGGDNHRAPDNENRPGVSIKTQEQQEDAGALHENGAGERFEDTETIPKQVRNEACVAIGTNTFYIEKDNPARAFKPLNHRAEVSPLIHGVKRN